MPVRLTIRPPRTTKPQVVEFSEERVTIGRSSRCDVRIPLRVVSGHHLTLSQTAAGLFVRDENSTNGTLFDGVPLPVDDEHAIHNGGRLEILDLCIDVEVVPDLGAGFSLAHTGTMARQMLGDALFATESDSNDESAYLDVVRGPSAGQKLAVPDDLDRGRVADASDAAVSVPGLEVALEIYRDGDGFGIALADDADASVRVGGSPLVEPRRLASGQTIDAGTVELRFVDPLEAYLEELDGSGAPASDEHDQHSPISDTLTAGAESPTTDALDEKQKQRNPASTPRTFGPVEVGVIALSIVSLAGVVYLLLSIFGVV